ncbi:MAG: ATP phosphoribosyltransferase regulatory subunit [Pseudomonadota bacterium]
MIRPVLAEDALAEVEGMTTTLARIFADAGFTAIQPAHLFPAETLLDLYGEDVRARAFLFPDPALGGELCLRPDFTVPVALSHGARGWDRPGAYTYQGPVFRRQEVGTIRPIEYMQAGIEDFGAPDRAATDARVYALINRGLEAIGAPAYRATIGDLGVIFGLLDAIGLSAHRHARLRRHLWRPQRFQQVLEQYAAPPAPPSPQRAGLIAAVAEGRVAELAAEAGEIVGRRTLSEVMVRAKRLAETAEDPPIAAEQAELIEAVLSISGPAPGVPARLRALAEAGGVALAAPITLFEARLDAMEQAGIDVAGLTFDAAFGRNLEYYDGFVFEIVAQGGPDLPPLAGGGRYDAITARLGATGLVPAVGAMIRPEAVREARR